MHSTFLLSTNLQLIALLIALLVLGLLIYWEVKRNRRVLLRIILSALTVGSLLLIALQPSKEVPLEKSKAVYLTDNFKQTKLDSLITKYPNIKVVNRADLDKDSLRTYDTLHVLGDGFLRTNLPDSLNIPIVLSLNDRQEGFIDFQYTKKGVVQEDIQLEGTYYSTDTLTKKIILVSLRGEERIQNINQIGHIDFNFQHKALKDGRYLYRLVVEKNDSIFQEEVFPIIIQKRTKLKVLIVNNAPNFETKYLKNWLAEGGQSIAIRSTISKEKYNTEFINFSKKDLSVLNQKLLQSLDVIVIYASTIHQLESKELVTLRKAIQKGLGLIILPDGQLFTPELPAKFQSFFFGVNYKKNDRKELIISNLVEEQKTDLSLNCFPYQADLKINVRPIIKDVFDLPIVVTAIKDQGRISSTILPITYTLQLQGKGGIYNAYWSEVFKATTRNSYVENNWIIKEEILARPHGEIFLELHTLEKFPIGQFRKEDESFKTIPLQQNPLNKEAWEGRFWPDQTGWHALRTKEKERVLDWFFVQKENAWETVRLAKQRQANLDWLKQQHQQLKVMIRPVLTKREALPLWWFYLLFLLGIGGLWIEEKI